MKNYNDYLTKTRFYIEPGDFSGWIFRKEGSDNIIKRDKFKMLLITYAEAYCHKIKTELVICDENGMLEDIIYFGTKRNDKLIPAEN